MSMASTSQPSHFFSLSLKSINLTSSSSTTSTTNLFIPTNLKTHTFKSLKISASPTNNDSQNSEDQNPNPISKSVEIGAEPKVLNFEAKPPNPTAESIETEAGNKGPTTENVGSGKKEIPLALKLAMEKAKEYKKKKGDTGSLSSSTKVEEKMQDSGLEKTIPKSSGNSVDRKLSSIDFVGLNFSDKKQSRGLPPGLVPMENNFSEKVLSDVEMIVGDTSQFGSTPTELNNQEDSDLYKPKVSTWGVFPRPNNISKTFGGGRTIRPGDVLETEEDKTAKDARTKQLLAAYKDKMGLNIDPTIKSSCEKALKDGDNLMDNGKLKEALPYYEKIMKELPFQNELHGFAALQWSICQDSRSRQSEARVMYEKLQSHPNVTVRKKAKQFLFGFQAMEILKVKSSSLSVNTTDYRNYFEAFVQDKTSYPQRMEEEEDGALQQVLPYLLFLVFPIIFVLVLAARKGI